MTLNESQSDHMMSQYLVKHAGVTSSTTALLAPLAAEASASRRLGHIITMNVSEITSLMRILVQMSAFLITINIITIAILNIHASIITH